MMLKIPAAKNIGRIVVKGDGGCGTAVIFISVRRKYHPVFRMHLV
jgi:hypothetical protein